MIVAGGGVQESYGTYAELRHKVAAVIASENTEPDKVVDLEAQRDYMDMVCRSFASRLERRRNLVISSARFHRLVEQVCIWNFQTIMTLCSVANSDG